MKSFLLIIFSFVTVCLTAQQTFENVAPLLGITGMSGLGHSVGWGDIDNDGYTDLLSVAGSELSILYNNGDATFKRSKIKNTNRIT